MTAAVIAAFLTLACAARNLTRRYGHRVASRLAAERADVAELRDWLAVMRGGVS